MERDNRADAFVARLRSGQTLVGSWVACDNAAGTEALAGLGFDFLCIDGQHGLLDYSAWLRAVTVIDVGGASAPLIRVPANDQALIARALDTGACGIVVPLIDDAAAAAAAVQACRYPPVGRRSYGPMRATLRTASRPAEANSDVACVAMVETIEALASIHQICAVPGLDGVLAGPFDLTLALGGHAFGDPAVAGKLEDALSAVASAAREAGIPAGIHCPDGAEAAQRLSGPFSFATVSCDLLLLEDGAKAQLASFQSWSSAGLTPEIKEVS